MNVRRAPLPFAVFLVSAALTTLPAIKAGPPPRLEQTEWITRKLESTIIPRLEFREVGIVEAVEFLRKKSVELDPQRAGVPIYLQLQTSVPVAPKAEFNIPGIETIAPGRPALPVDARITVSLTNIPLSEAFRYVTSLAGMKFRVLPDGLHIVPAEEPELLYDRDFVLSPLVKAELERVQKNFTPNDAPQAPIEDLRSWLIWQGIAFEPGTAIALDESKTRVRVRNSMGNFELIEMTLEELEKSLKPVVVPGPEVPKVIGWPDEEPFSQAKAKRIALGRVSIVNATLREAVQQLTRLSVESDRESAPELRGVYITIQWPSNFGDSTGDPSGIPGLEPVPNVPLPRPPRYSYTAANVSLAEAAEAVATSAEMKVLYFPEHIAFATSDAPAPVVTIEYLVLPELIGRAKPTDETPERSSGHPPSKDWLLSSGVPFGPSATAIFIPSSNKLIVRNTMEKQQEVRAIVEKAWKEYYEAHPPRPAASAAPDAQ